MTCPRGAGRFRRLPAFGAGLVEEFEEHEERDQDEDHVLLGERPDPHGQDEEEELLQQTIKIQNFAQEKANLTRAAQDEASVQKDKAKDPRGR